MDNQTVGGQLKLKKINKPLPQGGIDPVGGGIAIVIRVLYKWFRNF